MGIFNTFEAGILLWIQDNLRTDVMNHLMPYVSAVNNAGILSIATIILLLIWKRYRSVGITACAALASEFLLVNVLVKQLVARPRPYVVNGTLAVLGTVPADYSFPSGHTGSAFAVATVMLLCMPKRYGIPAVAVAVLIGLSRLYNVAHYPTDVIGGMLIGVVIGALAVKIIYPRIKDNNKQEKI